MYHKKECNGKPRQCPAGRPADRKGRISLSRLSSLSDKIRVSVIIPVFNAEAFLPRCVQSLLAQTLREIELILVDDGSTDKSPALCDEFAKDPRVRVIHQHNGGPCGARNRGMELARGEFIGFADADDWCDPSMFEKLCGTADAQKADMAFCDYILEGTDSRTVASDNNGSRSYGRAEIRREILPFFFGYSPEELPSYKELFPFADYSSYIWLCVFRTSVIRENGLLFPSQSVYYNEDNLFNLNFLLCAERVVHLPAPLYHYRANDISLTSRYKPTFLSAKLNKYEYLRSTIVRNGLDGQYFTRLGNKICVESVNILNYYVNSEIGLLQKYRMIRETVNAPVIADALQAADLTHLPRQSPLGIVLRLERENACLPLLLLSETLQCWRRLRSKKAPH